MIGAEWSLRLAKRCPFRYRNMANNQSILLPAEIIQKMCAHYKDDRTLEGLETRTLQSFPSTTSSPKSSKRSTLDKILYLAFDPLPRHLPQSPLTFLPLSIPLIHCTFRVARRIVSCSPCTLAMPPPIAVLPTTLVRITLQIWSAITIISCVVLQTSLPVIRIANRCGSCIVWRSVAVKTMTRSIVRACRSKRCSKNKQK